MVIEISATYFLSSACPDHNQPNFSTIETNASSKSILASKPQTHVVLTRRWSAKGLPCQVCSPFQADERSPNAMGRNRFSGFKHAQHDSGQFPPAVDRQSLSGLEVLSELLHGVKGQNNHIISYFMRQSHTTATGPEERGKKGSIDRSPEPIPQKRPKLETELF